MTTYQVTIYLNDLASAYITRVTRAKMPLGAMVFAMQRENMNWASSVVVAWDGSYYQTYYNVRMSETSITFDRETESKPGTTQDIVNEP